jgi:hypothetical protein
MADIDYEVVQATLGQDYPPGTQQIRWPRTGQAFATTSAGVPYLTGSYSSISIQVICTTFNGATVTIQGSNELQPVHYATLRDAIGTTLTFLTQDLKQMLEHPVAVRPVISGSVPDATSFQVIMSLSTMARK